ncbi:fibronectin type III domain-containing protein [Actinoplanes sp. TBRC 11911]|uniref:fibronectin type III domain-containing protein n=1 Tax=Actinoplanes sp. TBRC 11911 TaxID=2729386 RepID=UPI00145F6E55|nr:fibronectin type III domain-containing protein [Actinoplanes sp. TBRC 11911]NMO53946.1 fibronectin type III domain-containing protein [Actinoplanes sp. TBRC 11911]
MLQRVGVAVAGLILVNGWFIDSAQANSNCPPVIPASPGDMISCTIQGIYNINLMYATPSIDIDIAGGGGGGSNGRRGGNGSRVLAGNVALPPGTATLQVVVGHGGMSRPVDRSNGSGGGGGSGIYAYDENFLFLGKVAIAAGGGAAGTHGDGGDGDAPGSIDGGVSQGGMAGSGPNGGVTGAIYEVYNGSGATVVGQLPYGDSDSPSNHVPAFGGPGWNVWNFESGGGGGGYAGGGGGGGSADYTPTPSNPPIFFGGGGGGGSSLNPTGTPILHVNNGVTDAVPFGGFGYVKISVPYLPQPGSPTNLQSTHGDGSARLTFDAPVYTGTSSLGDYTATDQNGVTHICPTVVCDITGLVNGTSYTFTVHASNSSGPGAESGTTTVVPSTVPDPPQITAVDPGDAQVEVTFTGPDSAHDGGDTVDKYTVTDTGNSSTNTCATSPCTVFGLANGSPYRFVVTAHNVNGWSTPSAQSDETTPATSPQTPTIGSATAGNGQASVAFQPGDTGGATVTYTAASTTGNRSGTCAASPCTVGGLTNGQSYRFKVTATNWAGSSVASAASNAAVPIGPVAAPTTAPTGLRASSGSGWAEVAFEPISGATSYVVTAFPGGRQNSCAASPCRVSGLTNGQSYSLSVHGINAGGDSPESATVTATPLTMPEAPRSVTAVARAGQASVRFDAPLDNGGSPISRYTATATPGGFTGTCSASPCTVRGLTNGTAYTFTVHATTAAGDSPESASSAAATPTVSPVGRPNAPGTPVARARVSSVRITWTASTSSIVTGYTVTADPGPATCTTTGLSCTLGAVAGTAYRYRVVANAAGGRSAPSRASASVTAAAPASPVTAPTTTLRLTTDKGRIDTIAPGATVTLVGSGYAPHSTVTLTAYPKATLLGTAVTDERGFFRRTVTVPTAVTDQIFVSLGAAPDGQVRAMRMPVTLTPAAGTLPVTGASDAWIALVGLIAVAAGLLLRSLITSRAG